MLRARLDIRLISESADLLLLAPATVASEDKPEAVRSILVETVRRLPVNVRIAAAIMTGIEGPNLRSEPRTVTKTHMARALAVQRHGHANARVSARRVEQIEREEILPAFLKLLAGRSTSSDDGNWTDYTLEMTLRPATHQGFAVLRTVETFVTTDSGVAIAVTELEDLADRLCSLYPTLTDIAVPSEQGKVRVAAFTRVTADDLGIWESLPLHRLSAVDMHTRYPGLQSEDPDIFVLSSDNDKQGGAFKTHRIVTDQDIKLTDGYCYWSAPRPVLVKAIRVDAAGLPGAEESILTLQPRFGVKSRVTEHEGMHLYEMAISGWIGPGSGFGLQWRPRSEEIL